MPYSTIWGNKLCRHLGTCHLGSARWTCNTGPVQCTHYSIAESTPSHDHCTAEEAKTQQAQGLNPVIEPGVQVCVTLPSPKSPVLVGSAPCSIPHPQRAASSEMVAMGWRSRNLQSEPCCHQEPSGSSGLAPQQPCNFRQMAPMLSTFRVLTFWDTMRPI